MEPLHRRRRRGRSRAARSPLPIWMGFRPDDVVIEEWSLGPPTIVLHYNRGGLEFHPVRVGSVAESPIRLDVVDLTRDGALDVLAVGRLGALVSIQDRLGSFPPFMTIASAETLWATARLIWTSTVTWTLTSSRSDNVGMVLHRGDGTGQFGPAIPLHLQGRKPAIARPCGWRCTPRHTLRPSNRVCCTRDESGPRADCNLNRAPDECDLGSGLSLDVEGDGLPDAGR